MRQFRVVLRWSRGDCRRFIDLFSCKCV